jgi:hypothetical protein
MSDAQVQLPDPTKKPGFADMMRIGTVLCLMLKVINPAETKFTVDVTDATTLTPEEFVVNTVWGEFFVNKAPIPGTTDVWSGAMWATCEEHGRHKTELPFAAALHVTVRMLLLSILENAFVAATEPQMVMPSNTTVQ